MVSFILNYASGYLPIIDLDEEEEEPLKRQRHRRAIAMIFQQRQVVGTLPRVASRMSPIENNDTRPHKTHFHVYVERMCTNVFLDNKRAPPCVEGRRSQLLFLRSSSLPIAGSTFQTESI